MDNYRIIAESELKNLLAAANRYWALSSGGVDNWEFYGEALGAYLEECMKDYNFDYDEDFGFNDIVKLDLDNYEIYHSDKTE